MHTLSYPIPDKPLPAKCPAGPTPDVVTYNTVLAACSHLGDTNNALKIFSQMLDAGVGCCTGIAPVLYLYGRCSSTAVAGLADRSGGMLPSLLVVASPCLRLDEVGGG